MVHAPALRPDRRRERADGSGIRCRPAGACARPGRSGGRKTLSPPHGAVPIGPAHRLARRRTAGRLPRDDRGRRRPPHGRAQGTGRRRLTHEESMTVIDVHTHMFSRSWLEQIRAANDPHYEFRINSDGVESVFAHGAQFLTPLPGHFDYGRRVARMDEVGIDVSIVSLTAPNVFFGGEAASTAAARAINDDMAQAQRDHPDRIRWMALLPWEYPDAAVAELARAHAAGAVGVMVLA